MSLEQAIAANTESNIALGLKIDAFIDLVSKQSPVANSAAVSPTAAAAAKPATASPKTSSPAKAAKSETVSPTDEADKQASEAPVITPAHLIQLCVDLSKAPHNKKEDAFAVLAQCGAKKVPDLKPEVYALVHAKLTALKG